MLFYERNDVQKRRKVVIYEKKCAILVSSEFNAVREKYLIKNSYPVPLRSHFEVVALTLITIFDKGSLQVSEQKG